MICHAHVTLDDDSQVPKGWKRTEIILTDGERTEQDIMVTKYFSVGQDSKYASLESVISEANSISGCTRVKIEKTDSFDPVSREKYAEFHVKVAEGTRPPKANGWVKSRNPRDYEGGVPRFFYNKRAYSGNMDEIIAKIKLELEDVDYVELKIEQNIYDSNRASDAWWA